MNSRILKLALLLALATGIMVPSAQAQFGTTQNGALTGGCPYAPVNGIDNLTGLIYGCANNHVWTDGHTAFLPFQGATATAITTANFTVLAGPGANQKISAGMLNQLGKTVHIHYSGLYTTAAASLLNAEVSLCTVNGCGSGTVVSPVGCVITTTNQANVLANGQFDVNCDFTTSAIGSAGTVMATSVGNFQLGTATSGALSPFAHLATGVSTAIDLTVDQFVAVQFKFTTSNAGNAATLLQANGGFIF